MTPEEKKRWQELDLDGNKTNAETVEVTCSSEGYKEYLFGLLKQYEAVHGKGPEELAVVHTEDGDYSLILDENGDITMVKKSSNISDS